MSKDIVKLAVDLYKGSVPAEFASQNPSEKLRELLIEANGGSDKIDLRGARDGRYHAVFSIIEQAIEEVTKEGLEGDEFFMDLVDFRNLAEGDMNEFVAEENTSFIVSDVAHGIAVPRRQRIGEKRSVTMPVTLKTVRVYEEMRRLLAGRVSWNDFMNKVVKAVTDKRYADIYTVFSGISAATPGLGNDYVLAGSYDEEQLLELVEHVQAATGKKASIYGTASALRKVKTAVMSDGSKDSYYNVGHFGKVAGVDMVRVENRHAVGTAQFILPNNKVYVLASDDKPIKYITEGNGIIIDKDPTANADLTQEYVYAENTGCGLLVNSKMGIYEMT